MIVSERQGSCHSCPFHPVARCGSEGSSSPEWNNMEVSSDGLFVRLLRYSFPVMSDE